MEGGGFGSSVRLFEARRSSPAGKKMGKAKLLNRIGWEGAQSPTGWLPTKIVSSQRRASPPPPPAADQALRACSLHEIKLLAYHKDRIKLLSTQSFLVSRQIFPRHFRDSRFSIVLYKNPSPGWASPGAISWLLGY